MKNCGEFQIKILFVCQCHVCGLPCCQQALREELARQRTGMQSEFGDNYSEHSSSQIKELEKKISRYVLAHAICTKILS